MFFVACAATLLAAADAGDTSSLARPPYPVAHDAPLAARQRLVERGGQHERYRVEFNGIRGDRVPGYLYTPVHHPARHPAVLLQYGSGANKDTKYIVTLGRRFADRGFVVLTIDSALRGERAPKHAGPLARLATQFDRDTFVQYCGDYSRAVDYLDTRPDVDPGRIAYVGISWGAITGITFSAYDPRIKVVVSMVGGGGFLGKIVGGTHAEEVTRELDPVNQVHLIPPRPLLLVNATHDRMIARPYAEALHRAAGPTAKIVWVDTDHEFQGADREKVAETVIQFVEENLPRK